MQAVTRAAIGSILVVLLGVQALVVASTAMLSKHMLVWPVPAPLAHDAAAPAYAASNWRVVSGFGWRADPTDPRQQQFHEGLTIAGPLLCAGCRVLATADVVIRDVRWDEAGATDPNRAGAGVIVEMALRNPDESGMLNPSDGSTAPLILTFGHLEPYRVYVRTVSCTQTVFGDCADYSDDARGRVDVVCQARVVRQPGAGARRTYTYATPGACTATVSWPAPVPGGVTYAAEGPTTIRFDQRIRSGERAQDAAITFSAQRIPPPVVITGTVPLTLTVGGP